MDSNCEIHFLSTQLPEPLPTLETIGKAKETFPPTVNRNKVVRVGEHYVVKYGRQVDILKEGWTMHYLQKTTSVAIPEVYAIFTDKTAQHYYVIMEYIKGPDMRTIWGDLEISEKEDITAQLAAYFTELHALPSPGFFGCSLPSGFGSLDKKTLPDFLFNAVEGPGYGGPYENIQELRQGLVKALRAAQAEETERANFFEHILPQIMVEDGPVFSHGDLQLRNIILRDDGKVILIDWAMSGWYPSCWDYAYTMFAAQFQSDWHAWVPKFLPEYPSEYLLLGILRDTHFGSYM